VLCWKELDHCYLGDMPDEEEGLKEPLLQGLEMNGVSLER
jgi:hypothetical protein